MTGQPISLSPRRNPVLAHHAEDYFVTFFLASAPALRAFVGQHSFLVTRRAKGVIQCSMTWLTKLQSFNYSGISNATTKVIDLEKYICP